MIPISVVRFGDDIEAQVTDVLRSGSIAQGPRVKEFEDLFASTFGMEHAIAVNNGTTALIAALRVCDLGPGDEVITSPFTFVATVNAILESGATAVLADISDDDFNLDADAVRGNLTARTRALLPVHLYGQTGNMTEYQELVETHGLQLIEDAAQAHGARFEGRSAGSFGIGAFSLYATKNITTGEGGVITTRDAGIADRLRILRNQGMRERYAYEMAGNNYRLTDIQAAIGIPQLGGYDDVVEVRRSNADFLAERLGNIPGLIVPRELPGRRHVWHQFTVRVTGDAMVSRDELAAALAERGVSTGIYYPKLIPDYDAYRDHPRVIAGHTPNARRIASEVLSLPVHQFLSADDLETIVAAVTAGLVR